MSDWTGNKHSVFVTNGDSSHSQIERAELDYYATNPEAVNKLLEKEELEKDLWECAAGEGHISKVLINKGFNVKSTDLVVRKWGGVRPFDFLSKTERFNGSIITNPPYKYASDFVKQALEDIEEGHKVVMFLKLTFLESETRKVLFKQYPPKKIYVFSKRINCALNGEEKCFLDSSAVCYAWFVWEKGYKGLPQIDWI